MMTDLSDISRFFSWSPGRPRPGSGATKITNLNCVAARCTLKEDERRPPLHLQTHFAASYFLALGGISDVSTGSNSNFGSSASGAKYAFVVFRKFLSSRSGKSGL